MAALRQQQQEQQRQAALGRTIEEFCRSISAALDNPSFETKQKILRLVVERIEFVEDQITIKHVIPLSDVRLQRNQHNGSTPYTVVYVKRGGRWQEVAFHTSRIAQG